MSQAPVAEVSQPTSGDFCITNGSRSDNAAAFLSLLHPAGHYEIRIPKARGGTGVVSGFFNDHTKAVEAIESEAKHAPQGIFVTVNEIDPAHWRGFTQRQRNRVRKAKKGDGTNGTDILMRSWIFLDIDAERPSGEAATDDELAMAIARAEEINTWLIGKGFPKPMAVMSGNGVQLFYPTRLPNSPVTDHRIKCFTNAVADKFSGDGVKVERTVHDAPRVCKVAGTWNRKGDNTPERPHRQTYFVVPHDIFGFDQHVLTSHLDEFVTGEPESPTTAPERPRIDSGWDGYYDRAVADMKGVQPYDDENDGSRRLMKLCHIAVAYDLTESETITAVCEATEDAPILCASDPKIQSSLTAVKNNNPSLTGKSRVDYDFDRCESVDDSIVWLDTLFEQYPNRKPEVIHGLLRQSEIATVIGASKEGKTWLVYGLLMALVQGNEWFGHKVEKSKVLLIDNELDPEEIAYRVQRVARLHGVDSFQGKVACESLKGKPCSLTNIEKLIERKYRHWDFDCCIIDAFYRCLPPGMSENDNAAMTAVYNQLNRIAKSTGSSIILNHHSSKGDQSGKKVTDVGSGAGAMSRATDTHIAIRPHQEDGLAVMEAVCRSNPKPTPKSLKFEFPLWSLSDEAPILKTPESKTSQVQQQKDSEGIDAITDAIRQSDDAVSRSAIRTATGIGYDRLNRLLAIMVRSDLLQISQAVNPSKKTQTIDVYQLPSDPFDESKGSGL